MLTVIIVVGVAIVGFVAGVLVGRNNKAKVEAVVGKVEDVVDVIKK